jgi:hypothetical protein
MRHAVSQGLTHCLSHNVTLFHNLFPLCHTTKLKHRVFFSCTMIVMNVIYIYAELVSIFIMIIKPQP